MPKVRASERDAFYEARRAELAAVALELWAERGFDQTSVAAIAREAGISKGAFYLYFESKEALLEEVMRRNSFLPFVQELVADLQHLGLEEAVHAFVRAAWRHLCDHRDLVLVALRELPTHLDEARKLAERLLVPANRLLAAYLESRMAPERARELSLIVSARGLVGMILLVFLTQEVMGVGRLLPVPEEEITRTIAELFLRGVTPARPAGPTA
jgi:AcrR family transcriptional regulator